MRLQPLDRNVFVCLIAIGIPVLRQSEPVGRVAKVAKGPAPADRSEKLLAVIVIVDGVAERLHDLVVVDLPLRRQGEPFGRVHGLVDLQQEVLLPLGQILFLDLPLQEGFRLSHLPILYHDHFPRLLVEVHSGFVICMWS